MPPVSTIERLKDSRVRATVTFEKEKVENAERDALSRLSQSLKLPGFRPGKVPTDMAKAHIDETQLLEETVRGLLPETVASLVQEHQIKPIVTPKVEMRSREPLTLALTFVEYPEVTIKNPDKIKIEKNPPKADDKDVETMVKYVLDQHRTTKPTDEAAQEGHQVTMNFTGKDNEGAEIEGIKTSGYSVTIGSKTLIPGFEDELKGLKKGDKKSFTLTFPETYHAEHLRNKPVTFDVHVTGIEEVHLPELTDEFAKSHLNADSADIFRTRVRESMHMQEEGIEHRRREQILFDTIRDATKVTLAPELVEEEEQHLAHDLMHQLQEQKMTLEDYLERAKMTREEFAKDLHDRAQKRLQLRFGIRKLIELKNIELTDEEKKNIPQDENAEQMEWQMKVEKLIEQMLA